MSTASLAFHPNATNGTPHQTPDADEAAIVERARTEAAAFGVLFERHHREIWRYLYRRTGDSHLADDLLADTFAALLQQLPRYQSRGIPIRHWLLRVATRLANRSVRQIRRRPSRHDGDLGLTGRDSSPAAHAIAVEEHRALISALRTLPAAQQAVLVLRYQEHLTVEGVAAVLGWRLGATKSRLRRARAALQQRLEREGDS